MTTENPHMKRTVTGLVLGAVLLITLYFRGWLLLGLVFAASAVALWEYFNLFWGPGKRLRSRVCAILLGWGMLCLTWMHRPQDALVFLGAGFVLTALTVLFRWDVVEENEEPFAPGAIFMAGMAYIPLLLLPATYLSSLKLVFVFVAVVSSDVTAYFVGTRFGHHKLWPRVSPKKSSEGALGSLLGCVVMCTLMGVFLGVAPWYSYVLLAVLLNAFAQLGDLFESALKRAVNVKDSGNLLPGHGGMLDRIDSLLFAMPVFAVVDQWYKFF